MTVKSGDDLTVELELPSGTIVALALRVPSGFSQGGVNVQLFEGLHTPVTADFAGFHELGSRAVVTSQTMMVTTAAKLDEPIEITDVAPGSYTACAILLATKPDGVRMTKDGPGFEFDVAGRPHCAPVLVADGDRLKEVALEPGLPK